MPYCLIPISIDGGTVKTVGTREGPKESSFANVHIFIDYTVDSTDSINAINSMSIWSDKHVALPLPIQFEHDKNMNLFFAPGRPTAMTHRLQYEHKIGSHYDYISQPHLGNKLPEQIYILWQWLAYFFKQRKGQLEKTDLFKSPPFVWISLQQILQGEAKTVSPLEGVVKFIDKLVYDGFTRTYITYISSIEPAKAALYKTMVFAVAMSIDQQSWPFFRELEKFYKQHNNERMLEAVSMAFPVQVPPPQPAAAASKGGLASLVSSLSLSQPSGETSAANCLEYTLEILDSYDQKLKTEFAKYQRPVYQQAMRLLRYFITLVIFHQGRNCEAAFADWKAIQDSSGKTFEVVGRESQAKNFRQWFINLSTQQWLTTKVDNVGDYLKKYELAEQRSSYVRLYDRLIVPLEWHLLQPCLCCNSVGSYGEPAQYCGCEHGIKKLLTTSYGQYVQVLKGPLPRPPLSEFSMSHINPLFDMSSQAVGAVTTANTEYVDMSDAYVPGRPSPHSVATDDPQEYAAVFGDLMRELSIRRKESERFEQERQKALAARSTEAVKLREAKLAEEFSLTAEDEQTRHAQLQQMSASSPSSNPFAAAPTESSPQQSMCMPPSGPGSTPSLGGSLPPAAAVENQGAPLGSIY